MKPAEFSYERPDNLGEALALLGNPDIEASPLAGGQSLMPMMNFRMAQPKTLVDLNGLDELQGIQRDGKELRIGAMTRYAELSASEAVRMHAPLIGMALPHIAHAAIRNRGTIGGSVSLADPAAEMPALMLALDARIMVQSANGRRDIAAGDFFLGLYETALETGELVTEISIPVASENQRCGFYELARRHGDYAMAGVAMTAEGSERHRIAFFGVSDRAVRAQGAEKALDGQPAGHPQALEVAVAALDEIEFSADLNGAEETKRHLAGVVLKRALERM
jgi:carbon-monoxide dehydrogenase medium subunit